MEEGEDLKDFDLSTEKDDLTRLKIDLDKAKCGCGSRFEYGNYINGKLCTKEVLCDNCDQKIDGLKAEISNQELRVLSIQIAKDVDKISSIRTIIDTDTLEYVDQVNKIRRIVHEE